MTRVSRQSLSPVEVIPECLGTRPAVSAVTTLVQAVVSVWSFSSLRTAFLSTQPSVRVVAGLTSELHGTTKLREGAPRREDVLPRRCVPDLTAARIRPQ